MKGEKEMKKFLAIIITVTILFSVCTGVSAHNIGDVINNTMYSDIVASINDYNIASFNIDGYTAIVAEDLRNYGFNVEWVPEQKALYISRNYSTNNVLSTYIAPIVPASQVGMKANDVLYTDIVTYINGVQIPSYNIGGRTIIYFNDLASFGTISYNDSNKRLDLDISDGLNYKIGMPKKMAFVMPTGLGFTVNSAGGIQIRWMADNNTNKTINYYTTTYYMYNSVGDPAYYLGKNYFVCKTVGPVGIAETLIDYTGKYEGEVYDVPCSSVFLHTIDLEYSDGTKETIYYNQWGYRY